MKNVPIIGQILLSVSLLTRLPVRVNVATDSDWAKCAAAFPFCGYILAVLATLPFMLLSFFGENTIFANFAINMFGAFFFVAGLAWLTRIFHIDGFCDACDAFTSNATSKEDRLKIMKDPHPGAGGIAYTIFLVLAKLLAIYFLFICAQSYFAERFSINNLMEYEHPYLFRFCKAISPLSYLIAVTAVARFAMVLLAAVSRYPREHGTGAVIIGKIPIYILIIAFITLTPLSFLIPWKNLLLAFIVSIAVVFYWKFKADKLLGGVTGDILGACCETTEVAVAFALVLPELTAYV